MNPEPQLPGDQNDTVDRAVGSTERLVLSVAETADALGLSDDLVYELTERGELPCLRFGRRKVIPRQAVDLIVRRALEHFDPDAVIGRLVGIDNETPVAGQGGSAAADPIPPIAGRRTTTLDSAPAAVTTTRPAFPRRFVRPEVG